MTTEFGSFPLFFMIWIIWMLFCLWFWRKRAQDRQSRMETFQQTHPQKTLSPYEETQCIAEFQSRRQRFLLWGMGPLALVWGVGFSALFFFKATVALDPNLVFAVMVISVLNCTLIAYTLYKCPICGTVPKNNSVGERGLALNPTECDFCGTRLK